MTTMRAKLQITSVTKHAGGNETIKFHAVAANSYAETEGLDEDNTFAKYSPSASMEILIANPALHGAFEPGQKFYVDFTPAA
jgi:hypothetical protein